MRSLLLPLLFFCPTYLCLELFPLGYGGLQSVSLGDPVWLYFDLDRYFNDGYFEGDRLRSVKWYKDDMLFYQFVPYSENDRKKMYNVDGVFLNLSRSNATHVFLNKSDLATEGTYRCEVFFRSFRKITVRKKMRVLAIPSEGPQINGVSKDYKIGDLVNVTCVFGPSKPLAQITWFINREEAPASYVKPINLPLGNGSTLLPTESQLSFVLSPGVHSVICAAVMPRVYSSFSLELLDIVDESFVTARHVRAVPSKRPLITGALERYNVGDEVDLNCSVAESTAHLKLEWTINREVVPPEFLSGDGVSSLGLRFQLTDDHWKRKEIYLVCIATTDLVFKTLRHFTLQ